MTNALLTGAGQLAQLLAPKARPGFSTDYVDYLPQRVRFSSDAYDPMAQGHRPEIDPKGFLIEDTAVSAAGAPVIILGSLSGVEEHDRVTIDGKETTRRFMIWKKQPDAEPIKGRGGGLRTGRGGWIKRRIDEIFLLINGKLCCATLFDAHHVVTDIQQQAAPLPIGAMYEAKWQLTKIERSDGEDRAGNQYFRREPRFELLGLAGEPNGPSEVELVNAKRLSFLIGQLNYPHPDVPLKLVVGGNNFGSPPTSPAPPPSGEDDYGAENDGPPDPPADDGLLDFLKK